MEDITKLNLYDLLDIQQDATTKEIRTAYRKKALGCHPDKHPDNPGAVKLFHQLSKALEILTDAAAKSAYDKVLYARKAAELRNRQLDGKRRKLKEDLEAREREAELRKEDTVFQTKKLQEEIARLRKQGSQQLNEEIELMRQQIAKEMKQKLVTDDDQTQLPRLKVRWTAPKSGQGENSYERLMDTFGKYGDIEMLVVSKRPGSALVEFKRRESANAAFNGENGNGDPTLTLTRLYTVSDQRAERSASPMPSRTNNVRGEDFESSVLMKLRRAQEKKDAIAS